MTRVRGAPQRAGSQGCSERGRGSRARGVTGARTRGARGAERGPRPPGSHARAPTRSRALNGGRETWFTLMSGETCTGGTILSVTLAPEAQAGAEEDAGRARKACGVETASRGARMRRRRRAAPRLASPGGRRGNGARPLGVRVTSLGTQSSGRAARDRLRVRDSGFKVGLGCGRGCCFCGCTAPAASPRPPLRPLTLSVWAERKSRPAHRCSKRLTSESRAYKLHRRVRSALRGPSGPGGVGRSPRSAQARGRPGSAPRTALGGLGRGSGAWVLRVP